MMGFAAEQVHGPEGCRAAAGPTGQEVTDNQVVQ